MNMMQPEIWLEEYGEALYAYAMLHVRDTHHAEDLVQETLIAALKAQKGFKGGSSVKTWLTGILRHKIMDEFRRQAKEAPLPDSPEALLMINEDQTVLEDNFNADGSWKNPLSDWGNAEKEYSNAQFWGFIEECIHALPPKMARLFIMREIWEMETDEVCKEMGISPTNLWTTLHRIRLRMRQCMEKRLNY